MGRLDDFLALPDVSERAEEATVSERLGPVTIKAMTADQLEDYQNMARGQGRRASGAKLFLYMVAGQMADPDVSDAGFLAQSGHATAADFVKAKLLPGEIAALAGRIMELSGFDADINQEVDEAKN